MERKIGEIFNYNGEWYQCLELKGCTGCTFYNLACADIRNVIGKCVSGSRSDTTSVLFKKLEKVGEPFAYTFTTDKIYNVLMQQYKVYYDEIIPFVIDHFFINNLQTNTIAIEIKQNEEDNKEDMEEYRMYDAKEDIPEFDKVVDECLFGEEKLNLKPFDLEAAKAGKSVCTRDGRKARIICFDAKGMHQPIIALITQDNGIEYIETYYSNGRFNDDINSQSNYDLMMLPEKNEGWVNIYNTNRAYYYVEGKVFKTKDEAMQEAKYEIEIGQIKEEEYTSTIKIEWEE